MISLKNILGEVINTFSVEIDLFVDSKAFISDILNEIRAVRGVTIVTSITPDDYVQTKGDQYVRLKMKFITREDAKQDMEKIKQDILTSDRSANDLRVPGVKSFKYKEDTLKRL